MVDIVNVPIGSVGSVQLDFVGGAVQLIAQVSLLNLLQGIRAKSTNAIENAVLDAAIAALAAVAPAPVTPPAA